MHCLRFLICLSNTLYFRDKSSAGVQTVCKWKICKPSAGINQHFYAEYYQRQKKTENRKCIKYAKVVTASNAGTSASNTQYKRCSVSNMSFKKPRGQSNLGMTKMGASRFGDKSVAETSFYRVGGKLSPKRLFIG